MTTPTQARIGYGSSFGTGDGNSPEVFTSLLEVTKITPPQAKVDSVDASHEASPGAAKEFIPGMVDYGQCVVEMNYIPKNATALALTTELASRPTKNRQIAYPDGSTLTFAAFLLDYSPDDPLDTKMTATATFKVTGVPTLVQAA